MAYVILGLLGAILGALVTWLVLRKEGTSPALAIETKARTDVEEARNRQLEEKWSQDQKDAENATDVEAELARWASARNRLRMLSRRGSSSTGEVQSTSVPGSSGTSGK